MARSQAHPAEFAAAEAVAMHAQVGMVVWEADGQLHYRTWPAQSRAILSGLTALLAEAEEAMRAVAEVEDEGEVG